MLPRRDRPGALTGPEPGARRRTQTSDFYEISPLSGFYK
jgi:hypothetical protein